MRIVVWSLLSVIALAAGLGAVLLLTPLGDRPLAALLPLGQVKAVDFATLELTDKPNQHLLCPPDFCAAAPHGRSPRFPVPVEDLSAGWRRMATAQPGVALLAEGNGIEQLTYVQRTPRFRFPDLITVRFIALAPDQSTLAVYSRSIYGRSDFGVNRTRVETWLDQLCRALEGSATHCPASE